MRELIKSLLNATGILKIIQKSRQKRKITKNINDYKKKYNLFSASTSNDNLTLLHLRIIICSHVIEKGLSHEDIRAGFGEKNVIELCNSLSLYIAEGGNDAFAISNAKNLLKIYHETNLSHGFDDSSYLTLDLINEIPDNSNLEKIGIKEYHIDDVKNMVGKCHFSDFAKCRSSVRPYDVKCIPIERTVLESCILVAQTAPNACNRQATRVHVLMDSTLFEKIEEIQLGCNGFGRNVSAFIFVTSDCSLYEAAEIKLPFFDAGIFTMNLVYALHEAGLFSCVLNASFPGNQYEEISNIIHIPDNEMICGLIAVSNLEYGTVVKVPSSVRRPIDEICSFVE